MHLTHCRSLPGWPARDHAQLSDALCGAARTTVPVRSCAIAIYGGGDVGASLWVLYKHSK